MIEIKEFKINPNYTEKEWEEKVSQYIEEIDKSGGRIVAAEPIEEVLFRIVGRKFTVEYTDYK